MPRGILTTIVTSLGQQVARPRFFVEAEFPAGAERWWTGNYGRTVDSKFWKGGGDLLKIGAVEDVLEPSSRGMEIVLSGIDPLTIAVYRGTSVFFSPARLWLGAENASGALAGGTIACIYAGFVDNISLRMEQRTVTATVRLEHEGIVSGRVAGPLRTHQDHLGEVPGDLFFSHVATLAVSPLISPGPGYKPPQ